MSLIYHKPRCPSASWSHGGQIPKRNLAPVPVPVPLPSCPPPSRSPRLPVSLPPTLSQRTIAPRPRPLTQPPPRIRTRTRAKRPR